MKKLITARGTNGAGKSWLAHELLRRNKVVREIESPHRPGKVAGLILNNGVALIGSYHNKCGGADGIGAWIDAEGKRHKGMDLVEQYVWKLARQKDVQVIYCEGMTMVGWERWYRVSNQWRNKYGEGMVWLFFDTPQEVCIERVLARNGGKEFNHKNLDDKFRCCERLFVKADTHDEDILILNHKNPYPRFLKEIS